MKMVYIRIFEEPEMKNKGNNQTKGILLLFQH